MENNPIIYRGNNPITNPPNVRSMIVEDLGYCCPWVFFQVHRKTNLIAARLGVTPRAVRFVKSRCDSGDEPCRNAPNCMKVKLKVA